MWDGRLFIINMIHTPTNDLIRNVLVNQLIEPNNKSNRDFWQID